MIDLSHANSRKDFKRQIEVAANCTAQLADGEDRIFGVMIESHLKEGRQDLLPGKPLLTGVSITDACLGWEDTLSVLELFADGVRKRRLKLADH
jgi:3-deoxy-7-phosphoheptulonate synthase